MIVITASPPFQVSFQVECSLRPLPVEMKIANIFKWYLLRLKLLCSLTTHFCAYEAIFLGLIGKFFKINIFNILTSQKQDMTEIKLVWLVITTGHCPKIILSPDVAWMDEKDFTVFVKISTLSRCAWYHLQNPSAGLSIYRNLLWQIQAHSLQQKWQAPFSWMSHNLAALSF